MTDVKIHFEFDVKPQGVRDVAVTNAVTGLYLPSSSKPKIGLLTIVSGKWGIPSMSLTTAQKETSTLRGMYFAVFGRFWDLIRMDPGTGSMYGILNFSLP